MTPTPEPISAAASRGPAEELPRSGSRLRARLAVLLPLVAFLALAALFLVRLGAGDASRIPSALIGHPAPQTDLPAVPGLERAGKAVPGIEAAEFKGAVTVLNVWASWCVPCHDEAPLLMQLANDSRIRVVGINYKDEPDNARRFLGRYGNPFTASGADANGRAAIEWGVYGCRKPSSSAATAGSPTKLVGPITPANLDGVVGPEIERRSPGREPVDAIQSVAWVERERNPGTVFASTSRRADDPGIIVNASDAR
jgi:cytochrome c biogenesis protein CcmG/thiol:disulfide interchange protein DsbE